MFDRYTKVAGGILARGPSPSGHPTPSVITVAERRSRVLLHPTRVVVIGFLMATLVGAGLLSLPVATTAPGSPPFRDGPLHGRTSAVTVTGLSTVDTATYWTPFGQAVILVLIQFGGLGIMTSASLLLLSRRAGWGLSSRLAAQTETQSPTLGDLAAAADRDRRLHRGVRDPGQRRHRRRLRAAGADWGSAAWEGLFHGVSAFNNAGFSLYSDNLVGVATDGWILIPVALAVIVGGLGFPVWMELHDKAGPLGAGSLHTKLTLVTTAALLVAGTLVITAFEWGNPDTIGAHDTGGRLLGGSSPR